MTVGKVKVSLYEAVKAMGCEMLRLPQFLDSRLTDDGEVGMTVRDQILIHDKIKSRLNSGNACYHSFQNLLSSCLCLEM
jgi:hypothetical protein